MQRQGFYEFREKGKFLGSWLNRYPHGPGKLETDEMIYEGYWHSELRCGFGKVTDKVKQKTFRAGWSFQGDKPEIAEGLWSNDVCQSQPVWSNLNKQKLTDADWKLIMTGAEQVKRSKDEVLIEQGKKNTKLIRCKSGSLRIEKVLIFFPSLSL